MRTPPFPDDLFYQTFHTTRSFCPLSRTELVVTFGKKRVRSLNHRCKYYHRNPAELNDLANVSDNLEALIDCDDVLTIIQATMDTFKRACFHDSSIDNNFKELDNACPTCEAETESVNPKWLEHHQSGHLVKDKTCPICMEESGRRVVHWKK